MNQITKTCWWCGAKADSREHKYKKSDIEREFGVGSFKDPVLRMEDGSDTHSQFIRGPNSNLLKYDKVLCERCNNSRSKPFDTAYDELMDYLKQNEGAIYATGELDLAHIFGDRWREKGANVSKYLAKHFICRIAINNIEVTKDVIDWMNDTGELETLSFFLVIRTDTTDLIKFLRNRKENDGYISLSSLKGDWISSEGRWDFIYSTYNYRGFSFGFVYSKNLAEVKNPFLNKILNFDMYMDDHYAEIKRTWWVGKSDL